jgi:hypothetical protein
MPVLAKPINPKVQGVFLNKMLGWCDDHLMIKTSDEKAGIVTKNGDKARQSATKQWVTLKCKGCKKLIRRVVPPSGIDLVDEVSGLTLIQNFQIKDKDVYGLFLCQPCSDDFLAARCAPLKCKKCGFHVAWLEPKKVSDKHEIVKEETYHIAACPQCDPKFKKPGRIALAILEFKE